MRVGSKPEELKALLGGRKHVKSSKQSGIHYYIVTDLCSRISSSSGQLWVYPPISISTDSKTAVQRRRHERGQRCRQPLPFQYHLPPTQVLEL